MQFVQKIFIVLAATSIVVASASSIFGRDSEIGLLNYMARANDLLQQDPARSLDCFNKYIPLITEIANNYETNFKACLNDSEAASLRADEATLGQRNDLANAAEASCALLKQCQDNQAVESIFQCYIDGGSANIQTMYAINSNASQELAALREQYYLIKNSEYKCTNETKRIYEKKSSEAYAGLNNCILGKDEVVTTEPSTTTTTEETTEAPIETTSNVPESSENPATTTSASESTEKLPEETTIEGPESTSESSTEAGESTTSDISVSTTLEPESTETVSEESTTESQGEVVTEVPENNAESEDYY